MPKPKIKTIHIDLDGVLADFEGKYVQMFGARCHEHDDDLLWANINQYRDSWFVMLSTMPGAHELVDAAYETGAHVRILTATGHDYHEVSRQKCMWVNMTFGIQPDDVTTVRKGTHKQWFATPNDLLIDDALDVITPWQEQGGHAIHYQSAEQAINELWEYF